MLALRDVLVVGSDDLTALVPDTRIIHDLPLHWGQGPIAGLAAACHSDGTSYRETPRIERKMVKKAKDDKQYDYKQYNATGDHGHAKEPAWRRVAVICDARGNCTQRPVG